MTQIWIPGEFTTANEFIAATNRNRYIGANIKKVETERVKYECNSVPKITQYPVTLVITWIRKNRKSDPDNVSFAVKFILDGLQLAGVLNQDTWRSVTAIVHKFGINPKEPGVLIEVKA